MHTLTIAIIDDDKVDRLISKKLIERAAPGTNIIEFSGGMEALNYFSANALNEEKLPSVVLLDIRMPLLSGWEYLDRYKHIAYQLERKPRHYIHTSSIDPQGRNPSDSYIFGHYTKPLKPQSLMHIIQSAASQ